MRTTALSLCVLAAGSAAALAAGLEQERALMQQDPAAAAASLQDKLRKEPSDPWLLYNAAVAAYASKDFSKASDLWQQLSAAQMPEELKDKVWMQIGNVSYRLAQPKIESEPEGAIPGLEQAREALRVSVNFNKENLTAAKNLTFIESILERLYARLSRQLFEEAKEEPHTPTAVQKLEASLPYARQALDMNPKSEQRQQEKKEVEKLLAEKLQERAEDSERTADRTSRDDEWEINNAKENYEKAIGDFQQAKTLTPADKKPEEGEKRVEEKLANLLSQAGRQDQRQAESVAEYRPDMAMDEYQKALENFQQAQSHKEDHADAKAGEQEVREAMEQLHLAAGDKQLANGERLVEPNPSAAIQNLEQAIENFQAAQTLDPKNASIQPRIDRANELMPEALTNLAQQQQQMGEQMEQWRENEMAMENYQQADQNFGQAQQMQPGNQEAREGQQQVRAAMERLGQQMARQGQRGQQPGRDRGESREPSESFASMLARVKDEERYNNRESRAQHNRGQDYTEQRQSNLRNW